MFDGLVTARPQQWALNKKRTSRSSPNFELFQQRHLICSGLPCNAIPWEQTMSRTRVFDWHKRCKSSKSACMLKLRVTTMLFVFFDDRDIVYHEIVHERLSLWTSNATRHVNQHFFYTSTNPGTSHLPSQTHQAGSLRDQELNAGSRLTRRRMLPSASSSSWPRSRSQCLSILRTNQPLAPCEFWLFQNMKNVIKVTHYELWLGSDEAVKHQAQKELWKGEQLQ